jgi:RHS repeat-associated protein
MPHLLLRAQHSKFIAMALLCFAFQLSAQAQTQTVTREVQYGYNAVTGLLEWERVDPQQATCAETVYEHDEYGNRKKVTVRPCVAGASNVATSAAATFAARVTDNSFDAKITGTAKEQYPAGAYLTKSIARRTDGTVGKQSEAVFDPRFGAAIVQTDVASQDATKSLSKRAEYDELGRLKTEYMPVAPGGGPANESRVEYQWSYCNGVMGSAAGPACIDLNLGSMSVNYASAMLVDPVNGAMTNIALLGIKTAYYVEAVPRSAGNAVIGARSRTHYDSLHREIVKETESYSGQWTTSVAAYDQLGGKVISWGSYFGRDVAGTFTAPPAELGQWTASLDLLHRPTQQSQYWRGAAGAAATIVSSQLSYNGLVASATIPAASSPDGVARTTSARKNAVGKTVQTVDAYGATLTSAYDPAGNLVQTVDALGNTTTITYTAVTARFKTAMTDPNQGAWSYAYDALGQLKTQTDAKAQVTTLAYDEFGRLTQKTNPTQNGTWYHDKTEAGAWCAAGLNRVCESKAGNGATTITREATTYDALGRPSQTTTTRNRTYTSSVAYDSLGRVQTQTYPTGFALRYDYSPGGNGRTPGVLEKVADNANAARVFWRIDTITAASVFDAKGNVIRSDLGNGLGTNHAFDPISGKAFNLRAGTSAGGFAGAQDHRYTYDLANNVATRTEAIRAVTETFGYDRLDRLTSYATSSTSDAAANRSVTLDYNAIGNLLRKGDLGTYGYVAGRPHAVDVAAGTKYNYDANGSLSSTTGNQLRNITWTGFNQPESMSYLVPGAASAATVAFTYDEDFQRIREVITDGTKVRTVDMLHPDNQGGLGFEREQIQIGANAPTVENRHYISVSGMVIAVVKTQGDALPAAGTVPADVNATNYWHKDSLGSIVAVSNATGSVLERMAFDAWGKRVRDTGLADPSVNPTNGDRGFTGHEHLDEMQLVHMNGRVYDPLLGKFLSVDPVVGNPNDLQTYNRYSYVYNQPTRYADATGNCPWCAFVFLVGAVMAQEGNKYWSVVGRIMMIVAAPQMVEAGLGNASTVQGMNAGALAGATDTAAVSATAAFNVGGAANSFLAAAGSSLAGGSSPEDAFRDGVFAIGFTSVGATYGGAGKSPQLLAAHAFLGCAQSAMSGGKCGPGAMAAFVAKGTTVGLDGAGVKNPVAIGVATTIAGGTASVIGGGKFANGAFQAGFGYVFNYLSGGRDVSSPEEADPVGGPPMTHGEFAVGAATTVGLAIGGPIGVLRLGFAGRYWFMLSSDEIAMLTTAELSAMRGGARIIGPFFKANQASETLVLTPGLTREVLLSYRQTAVNIIAKYETTTPNQVGIQLQQARIQLIDRALAAIK